MKIGIIGVGVVGSTLDYGFTRLGHEVVKHDIKLKTHVSCLMDADLVFVCVPTPQAADGSCDISIVERVVMEIDKAGYKGLTVIKSTVTPGTTDLFKGLGIHVAFCPEFLREKSTYSDFVENHDVLIIGAYTAQDACLIINAHGYYPKQIVSVTPLEAELCKYFSNTFNALRIIFANQFYEVCQALGANYDAVKGAVSKRDSIGGHYLDCNKYFRAFGGACLPKDTAAMAAFCKERGIRVDMFEWILDSNEFIKDLMFHQSEAAE